MYIELDIVYSYCVDKIFTSVLFSNLRMVGEKICFITFCFYIGMIGMLVRILEFSLASSL